MSWAAFVWTVLPTGGVLVAMLSSGKSVAMYPASKVLSTPVHMGGLQLSIASVMTAICMILSILSYSALRRSDMRVQTGGAAMAYDQLMRDVFLHGRNLYLSLLGLSLWAVAWRLKVLFDFKQLAPPPGTGKHTARSACSRTAYLVLGLLALLAGDVPLCRINYNLQLAGFVTPKKIRLLASAAGQQCQGTTEAAASGQCTDFCRQVRELSEERLASIVWARDWHVLGRLAARLFDEGRGVQQGPARIDGLFAKKSCVEVLRSVDKSSEVVNLVCMTFACISVLCAFTAFTHLFSTQALDNSKED